MVSNRIEDQYNKIDDYITNKSLRSSSGNLYEKFHTNEDILIFSLYDDNLIRLWFEKLRGLL